MLDRVSGARSSKQGQHKNFARLGGTPRGSTNSVWHTVQVCLSSHTNLASAPQWVLNICSTLSNTPSYRVFAIEDFTARDRGLSGVVDTV